MPDGMTIEDLVDHVRRIGVPGLNEEYRFIRMEPVTATMESFK